MTSARRAWPAVLAALITGALAWGPAGRAADFPAATLQSISDTASWSGQFRNLAQPAPEACLASAELCDTMFVHLNLPAGTWTQLGGMLVAIRWPSIDAFYDLDLYVYGPSETVVGTSNTLIYSQGEAAWVPNPVNGTYRVVVVPKTVVGPLPYDGFVSLQHGTTHTREHTFAGAPIRQTSIDFGGSTGTDLLPNLVPTVPQNFHIETGVAANFYQAMNRGVRGPGSCYPQESLGITGIHGGTIDPSYQPPTKCLRWDQGEFNYGDGPFELRVYTGQSPGTDVYQAIYETSGDYRLEKVGTALFDSAHGHFHYQNFSVVWLYDSNGLPVATAPEKGHCTLDIINGRFAEPEDSPNIYTFPGTCDVDAHQDADDPNDPNFPESNNYFRMGISVGWADVYPWFIPDQYIDITGLDNGQYFLRVEIDLEDAIRETNDADNVAEACVMIQDDSATPC